MKKFIFIFTVIAFISCVKNDLPTSPNGTPRSIDTLKSSDKAITAFIFTAGNNPGILSADIDGIIKEDSIFVTMPTHTKLNSLTPSITIKGISVSPSNFNSQDFTKPIYYVVTAEDETTKKWQTHLCKMVKNHAMLFCVRNLPG
jgi:hypothetical protein